MGGKKSNSQVQRLMKRAEARGDTYEPPEQPEVEDQTGVPETKNSEKKSAAASNLSPEDSIKLIAAKTYDKDLENIQKDKEMKSKDRRSAKRRAEAIAIEASGCSIEELLQWYEEYKQKEQEQNPGKETAKADKKREKAKKVPYIVFVGQLSFDTTKESLFKHFETELAKEHKVTPQTMSIRLLTDPKTKKSRGMAFVEVTDPEILYACLKLHQTFLEGRRINVERSVGGKGETRKTKIKQLREEQTSHFNEVVDTIFKEFHEKGEIQKGELDDGVIGLCKRHSAAVVQASLDEYVAKQGRDMENPSAYLSFLIGKMAEEGIREKEESDEKKPKSRQPFKDERPNKKPRTEARPSFSQQGVDMSISKRTEKNATGGGMSSIFPSSKRGRGRGH